MMMRGGDRNSGRKLEVTAKAGVVVLVLMVMRGRGRNDQGWSQGH